MESRTPARKVCLADYLATHMHTQLTVNFRHKR